jgi:Tol biopolymer transport system component
MYDLVFMRSTSRVTRRIAPLALLVALLAGTGIVGCGGGGGSNESGGGGSSGSPSGTLYWTAAFSASSSNIATLQDTQLARLSSDSQLQLGYGGGMFTDVEANGVLPTQVKINLREVAPNPYALRSSLGPFPLSGNVFGPVRPSPDGKLFTMNTSEDGERYVYVFNAALDITLKLRAYYHPVWLGNDRLVVASGVNLYTVTVASSPVVTRIGPDGLGLPGEGTAVPSVSPDGKSIAFVQGEAVWRVNVDGTGLAQLTKASLLTNWPSWSPDGSRLVVSSECNSREDRVVIISATETNQDRDAISPITRTCGPVYWLP